MKRFAILLLLTLPACGRTKATAAPCGNSAQACTIQATISGGKLTLNDPNQMVVSMPLNTKIEWTVTGIGTGYFWVVFTYDPANPVFGPGNKTYFKGDANTPATGAVKGISSAGGAYYAIFAMDQDGIPYFLDPKVIVNPGGPSPTGGKRKP